MRILVKELSAQRLFIGWTGEKNHVEFAFDFSAIFAEYPNADAYMSIKPPVGDIYPHTLNREGNLIVWDIYESDCAVAGEGVYQITFEQNETVVKSFIGYYTVRQSLVAEGEAPEPVEDWIADAQAALFALTGLTARAESLPAGSSATAEIVEVDGHKEILLGIPRGDKGNPGEPGEPGTDGISPVVSISTITGGHRITITDADGTNTFDVMDGEKGEDGETPDFSIGVVQTLPAGSSATVTITGTKKAPVLNMGIPQGAKGDPGEIPQETLDQIEQDISDLNSAITNKADIIVSSASGAIASFPDGAESTAKELVVNIEPVQEGTGDPSPDNVRPISGWSGANVSRVGKNLLDFTVKNMNGITATKVDGKAVITGTASASAYPVDFVTTKLQPGTYVWSVDGIPAGVSMQYSKDGAWAGYVTNGSTMTLAKESSITGYVGVSTGTTMNATISVMLEKGSTASSFIPYQGQSLSISFPSSAGIVYGGNLTVYEDGTGKLVVDRYYKAITSVQGKTEDSGGYFWYSTSTTLQIPIISGLNAKLISNRLKLTPNTLQGSYEGLITFYANGIIRWKEQGELTLAEYGTYLASNPLVICYEIKTPVEYELTNLEVLELLKGQNNVWADTGNTSVTYRADTKLYIDNKLAELVSQIVNS